jgi:hypothetical protein
MQPGDRCLVKLNNSNNIGNSNEKWMLACLNSIQYDMANVYVIELNER